MLRGIPGAPVVVERRRRCWPSSTAARPIARAIDLARPGDLVLVAGKGHEKYQVIGDRELPFDDVLMSQAALARRRQVHSRATLRWRPIARRWC